MEKIRPRTLKKHSRIIAKLALKKGIITRELYDSLYIDAFRRNGMYRKRSVKKYKPKYSIPRYYRELYYWEIDYFGEVSEYAIIDHVRDLLLFNDENLIDPGTFPYKFKNPLHSTILIIKELRKLNDKRKK